MAVHSKHLMLTLETLAIRRIRACRPTVARDARGCPVDGTQNSAMTRSLSVAVQGSKDLTELRARAGLPGARVARPNPGD